jgi:hypothetical protein
MEMPAKARIYPAKFAETTDNKSPVSVRAHASGRSSNLTPLCCSSIMLLLHFAVRFMKTIPRAVKTVIFVAIVTKYAGIEILTGCVTVRAFDFWFRSSKIFTNQITIFEFLYVILATQAFILGFIFFLTLESTL